MRGRLRLQVLAIGIGGHQALVGGDRAEGRAHLHLPAMRGDARRRRSLAKPRTGFRRYTCGAHHELHRMDMARASIAHTAMVSV